MPNLELTNMYERWLRDIPWYFARRSLDEIEEGEIDYLNIEIMNFGCMMKTYMRHFSVGRSSDQGIDLLKVIEECVEMDPEDLDFARLEHLSNEMGYLGVFLDRMSAVMGDAPIDFLRDAVKRLEDEIESLKSEEGQDEPRIPRLWSRDQILGMDQEDEEDEEDKD